MDVRRAPFDCVVTKLNGCQIRIRFKRVAAKTGNQVFDTPGTFDTHADNKPEISEEVTVRSIGPVAAELSLNWNEWEPRNALLDDGGRGTKMRVSADDVFPRREEGLERDLLAIKKFEREMDHHSTRAETRNLLGGGCPPIGRST